MRRQCEASSARPVTYLRENPGPVGKLVHQDFAQTRDCVAGGVDRCHGLARGVSDQAAHRSIALFRHPQRFDVCVSPQELPTQSFNRLLCARRDHNVLIRSHDLRSPVYGEHHRVDVPRRPSASKMISDVRAPSQRGRNGSRPIVRQRALRRDMKRRPFDGGRLGRPFTHEGATTSQRIVAELARLLIAPPWAEPRVVRSRRAGSSSSSGLPFEASG
jgi:hypothetical protein